MHWRMSVRIPWYRNTRGVAVGDVGRICSCGIGTGRFDKTMPISTKVEGKEEEIYPSVKMVMKSMNPKYNEEKRGKYTLYGVAIQLKDDDGTDRLVQVWPQRSNENKELYMKIKQFLEMTEREMENLSFQSLDTETTAAQWNKEFNKTQKEDTMNRYGFMNNDNEVEYINVSTTSQVFKTLLMGEGDEPYDCKYTFTVWLKREGTQSSKSGYSFSVIVKIMVAYGGKEWNVMPLYMGSRFLLPEEPFSEDVFDDDDDY